MFAVCANQKIRRSVWARAHRSARILTDSRGRAIQWDCRSEEEFFLIKDKNTKAKKRKACKTKLLSGMKRKYSLHCPQFPDIGNSQEFSMKSRPAFHFPQWKGCECSEYVFLTSEREPAWFPVWFLTSRALLVAPTLSRRLILLYPTLPITINTRDIHSIKCF